MRKILVAVLATVYTMTMVRCQPSENTCTEKIDASVFHVLAYKKSDISEHEKQIKRKNKGKSFSAPFDFSKRSFFIRSKSITPELIEQKLNNLLSNNLKEVFLKSDESDIRRVRKELCNGNNEIELVKWPITTTTKYYTVNQITSLKNYCFQIYQIEGSWIKTKIVNEAPHNRFWNFNGMGLDTSCENLVMYVPSKITGNSNPKVEGENLELWKEVPPMWNHK